MATRLEELTQEIMGSFRKEYQAAAQLDTAGMVTKIAEINAKVATQAKDRASKEAATRKETADREVKAVEGYKAAVVDAFGKVWPSLREGFNKLESVQRLSIVVSVGEDGKANDPLIMVNTPTKTRVARSTGNGSNGARGEPLTVDGKEYASAAAAKKELLPDKAEASMNRASIISALKTANYEVS